MRIGVLVATGPAEGDHPLIDAALTGALLAGDDAEVFLMDDGARYALDPRVAPWLASGIEITVCAMDAEARDLDPAAIARAGVTLGSQHDHGRLLRRSERFLSFT